MFFVCECSNRTFMELKFDPDKGKSGVAFRSNRTFMELKYQDGRDAALLAWF